MIVIINAQVTKKVRPRLPGAWDKAFDFYRFAKSAKICLRLIYLITIHPFHFFTEVHRDCFFILIVYVHSHL